MKIMTKSKNIRNFLTLEQKNEILNFYDANPESTIQKMCNIFARKFGHALGRTTIHRIIKSKNAIKKIPVRMRHKKRLFTEEKKEFLDEVYAKYLQKLTKTPMSKEDIMILAGRVARLEKFVENFGNVNFGQKWFKSFKTTYGLSYKKIKGHKKYIPQRDIDLARQEIRTEMIGYEEDDIYNSDTTAFQPNFNGATSWQPRNPDENLVIDKVN